MCSVAANTPAHARTATTRPKWGEESLTSVPTLNTTLAAHLSSGHTGTLRKAASMSAFIRPGNSPVFMRKHRSAARRSSRVSCSIFSSATVCPLALSSLRRSAGDHEKLSMALIFTLPSPRSCSTANRGCSRCPSRPHSATGLGCETQCMCASFSAASSSVSACLSAPSSASRTRLCSAHLAASASVDLTGPASVGRPIPLRSSTPTNFAPATQRDTE